jgi:hypothetical protein
MAKTNARQSGYKLIMKGWADAVLTDTDKLQKLQSAVGASDELLREAGFDITIDFHPDRR